MQVRYCDSCGAKLPDLDMPGHVEVALCEKCAAARGGSPATPAQYTPGGGTPIASGAPTSRRRSSSRLHQIKSTGPGRRTPTRGTAHVSSAPVTPATPAPVVPVAPVQSTPAGSMGFYFCEKCGKRVTNADLARGQGRDKQLKGIFCAGCSDGTMTVAFDAIAQAEFLKEDQARRTGHRRSSSTRMPVSKAVPRQPSATGKSPRSSNKAMVAVGAGAVILVFCAVLGTLLIGRNPSDHDRPAEKSSSADVPTAAPVSSSSQEPTPVSTVNPAADQLAKIQTEITPDLEAYAEVNDMLDQFLKSYAGTPEAQRAKALRAEIETNFTKLAEEALTDARAAAEASASSGTFDEAESNFRDIETRFGSGNWFESKGKAAVEEALAGLAKQREAWALKQMAGTLENARAELAAGRFEEASKLIANRARWPVELRTQASELAAAIEPKMAAAAAAKKRAEEDEAMLAGFDRLMMAGEYVQARDYAKSKEVSGAQYGEMLRSGERLAEKMAEAAGAVVKGARTQLGKKMELKLTNDTQKGTLKEVTNAGLTVTTTYLINKQEHKQDIELKWDALHDEQRQAFARLGGPEIEPAEAAVASIYSALGSSDLTAAREVLGATGDHPLGVRLAKVVSVREKRMAYASAMELAKEQAKENHWRVVVAECQKALEIEPGDKEAVELLEKARRLAVPWNPGDIKTLAWFDAGDKASITASDGLISLWSDKSGKGAHLRPGGGGPPISGKRSLNGLNVVDFDGRNYMYTSGNFATPASGNFAVFQVTGIDAAGFHTKAIITLERPDWVSLTAGASQFKGVLGVSGLKGRTFAGGPFAGPSIFEIVLDCTGTKTIVGYVDGDAKATCSGYSKPITMTGLGTMVKGGNRMQKMDGFVGEIIVCEDVTPATRQKIEGYLAHKWGLAANLPEDHPYKSGPPVVGQ